MKKIKEYIIHLLGGCTSTEKKEFGDRCIIEAERTISRRFMSKADELYGETPEEWCNEMYIYISAFKEVSDERYQKLYNKNNE